MTHKEVENTFQVGPARVMVSGRDVNPMLTEEYQLDRQATALKRAGDWDGAIAALRRRKAILGAEWGDDKLAKYLQRAGRFDEAMAEIQWLLDNSQAWMQALYRSHTVSLQQAQRARHCADVHGAASLICKREGRADLQAEHDGLAERYRLISQRLEPLAHEEMNRAHEERVARQQLAARTFTTYTFDVPEPGPASNVFEPLRARVQQRIDEAPEFFQAARHSPFDPLSHLREGDIDGARQVMQRLAYMVYEDRDKHPEQTAQFTRLMCLFVEIDPLFKAGVAAALPIIAKSPGIRQTELYPSMNMDVEVCRYVLYFAHETGRIRRVKKGSTYQVYLPQAAP